MQRAPSVWLGVSSLLSVVGYALVGSVIGAALGASMIAAAATVTAMVAGCDGRRITSTMARQLSDVLGPLMTVCLVVPGAQVVLPLLGPLKGICDAVAASRPVDAQDVGKLATATAAADGRFDETRAGGIAFGVAAALGGTVKKETGTMANIVPIPTSAVVATLATYATAFLQAIDETEGLQPGVDMKDLLKNAAKSEANAISAAIARKAGQPTYALVMSRAVPVLKWLGAIVTNSTPGPWKRDRAVAIINDPTVVFRPPSGVDRKAPTFPGNGGTRPMSPSSMSLGPWIGAAAGFAVGGPVGAVAGFAIGTAVGKK